MNAEFKETADGQAAQRAGEVETRVLEFTAKVDAFERDMWQLNQNLDSRLGVLNATVGGLQASSGGFGAGKGGGRIPFWTYDGAKQADFANGARQASGWSVRVQGSQR